ncbi:protein indeterminate-domain 9-like [Canna indica]|uniref:Protein indeterminate-domain 9-like n=1 Tax=Canna indica TaxID=4628 RepID=A0AAQ3Q5D3_9LILI|nr:protein indeterminate-domain 9-like [Canna indica]
MVCGTAGAGDVSDIQLPPLTSDGFSLTMRPIHSGNSPPKFLSRKRGSVRNSRCRSCTATPDASVAASSSKELVPVAEEEQGDPEAEVVALSPETLLAASSFVCEVCGKEFRRDQNLQIHRRGHNLPWSFSAKKAPSGAAEVARARRRVYVCPEPSCVHHDPARALGDLTGIKKHYSRKHGEKKWECERCCKKYAVRTDWKAHAKICGTREYECHCGTLFSRKDSFLVHREACETAEESPAGAAELSFGSKVSTVNKELLFPSLWGKSAEQTESEGG